MTVRMIKQDSRVGRSCLGTLAKSVSTRAKKQRLLAVVVYFDQGQSDLATYKEYKGIPAVGIHFNHDGGGEGDVVVTLLANTAVEVVKGILMNLPDITIAADEELQHILKAVAGRVDKDAKAVVAAVQEKWSAPEPVKDTMHPEGL